MEAWIYGVRSNKSLISSWSEGHLEEGDFEKIYVQRLDLSTGSLR